MQGSCSDNENADIGTTISVNDGLRHNTSFYYGFFEFEPFGLVKMTFLKVVNPFSVN